MQSRISWNLVQTFSIRHGVLTGLILFSSLAGAQTGGSASTCVTWSSTGVPFDSVYYTSAPNANGDRYVVGDMSLSTYQNLRTQITAPGFANQEFCGSVQLGPGLYVRPYVPTAAEWAGNYSDAQVAIRDPFTTNNIFAGNIIPSSRIPTTFAWRIDASTPTLPPTETPLRFVPVAPCRIADTRNPVGPFGAPRLAAGGPNRNFPILNSGCGIPSTAQAYSLNFTVVPQTKLDYITVFPTGQSQPGTSVLNSYDGRIKANAAIIPAGVDGGISLFATDATHLVIDVDGYFVPNTDTTALAFYPMTPCRIVDTREAPGPLGSPALSAGEERRFRVLSSNCSIPASAQAYALNYTVVPNGHLDYLTTWPSGGLRPFVSTLNAPTGSITANAAIVPAGDGGDLSVYVTGETHVIIDINGYFAPAGSGGLSLYPVPPCRIYDSRTVTPMTSLINTGVVRVANAGCGAFDSAKSFVLNATVVPVQSLLYLSLWGDGAGNRPNASVLNAPDGAVTSNLAFVPTTNGSISAFASESTHLILDISGYFAP